MPRRMTHVGTVRSWCQSLGVLTAVNITRYEAEMKLAAYLPLLVNEFEDGAFTDESLQYVARACDRGFPTFGELAGALSAWWRAHRPVVALPPPPVEMPRPPATPEEIAHVEQTVRETVAAIRAKSLYQEPREIVLDPSPRYLTPAELDVVNPLPGRKRV